MKFDVKAILEKVKAYWKNLSDKTKKLILAVGGGILVLALVLTAFFSLSGSEYRVLFPGMSDEEAAQVYATVQEMGVQPQVDASGQILVPSDQWDQLVFELNAQGYPRTTLSYDTFTSASGFTATEFEKRTALLYQAQDRMQQTLLRQEGIAEATVSFTVPESSSYIWDQANGEKSSAGITVLMRPGYELSPERVSAIKHLAATSVPNLDAEDVVVIDAATGTEAVGLEDPESAGYYSVQRLEFEEAISRGIEEKVERLLASRYGEDGVTAVATVEVDYDQLLVESKQYQPQGDTQSGVINHYDEDYSLNGEVAAEGIVGEENNTDAPPIYPNEDGEGEDAAVTDYHRNIDYDVSYILTQQERGEPVLESASVAVIVNDSNFTTEVQETLVELISRAVNITTDDIRVTNLNFDNAQPVDGTATPAAEGLSTRQLLLIGLGALLLLLVVGTVILLLVRRARKRRRIEDEAQAREEEERQRQAELAREIEEHKRALQNEAMAQANTKESAIAEEVRNFAHENPEITAALIRSILREDT